VTTRFQVAAEQHRAGQPAEAERLYREVLADDPFHADALHLLGLLVHGASRHEEACRLIGQALAVAPDRSRFHNDLGVALRELGYARQAAAAFRRATILDPDFVEAIVNSSGSGGHARGDDRIRLEAALGRSDLAPATRIAVHFMLGRIYDDLGEARTAFDHYAAGNRLKRSGIDYATGRAETYFSAIQVCFSPETLAGLAGAGSPDPTAIFIVGMPRSGTTLVEQILASHSAVHGADELLFLRDISVDDTQRMTGKPYPAGIWYLNPDQLTELGQRYLTRLRCHSATAAHITDKMPLNFHHIGMIRLLMPNAKIIHCRRNPLDTCVSIFKILFTGNFPFAYDLREIGEYYRLYDELMQYWHAALPGFIHDVQYEDLVASQEAESRRLLAFCGLEWEDRCLRFWETDRPVRTASADQVRRPLFQAGIGTWKPYADRLGPLFDLFGRPGRAPG